MIADDLRMGSGRSAECPWGKAWPSSLIIRLSGLTPGSMNGMGGLVRWFFFDRFSAGGTEAILPTIPTVEPSITA
jgi:hypothetical protein